MLKIEIVVIFLLSGIALADTLTVCEEGGGCNKTTIQAAINECEEGDRIIVFGGGEVTYGPINISKNNISIIGKDNPVIEGTDDASVSIDYTLSDQSEYAAVNINGTNVTLSGFEIKDRGGQYDVKYGIAITSSGNLIQDNIILNFEDCGIIICGASNNNICRNNASKTIPNYSESGTGIGISLMNASCNNITGNLLFDNNINIELDSKCKSNLICFNSLNGSRYTDAVDLNGSNKWISNYYEKHNCIMNESGFCDNSYTIRPGHTTDERPLSKSGFSSNSFRYSVICKRPDEQPLDLGGCNCSAVNYCRIYLSASANRRYAEVGDAIEYTINVLNEGNYLNEILTYCDKINFSEQDNDFKPCEERSYRKVYVIKEDDLPGPFEIIFSAIGRNPGCFDQTHCKVLVNLSPANITVTKTANPSSGCYGDPITFDINVTNTGKVPLDSVTVVDALPEGLECRSSTPNGTIRGRDITWNLEDRLEPGESNHTELVARIIQTSPGILNNTVNAIARNQNVTANDSDEVEVISCAKINVTKTANPSSGCPLDLVTFDINVTNTGKVPLDQVTVVDALPEGLEYNSSTPNETRRDGRNITWNLEEPLPANKSDHIMLVARIIQTSPGILNNTVNATGRHSNGPDVTDNDSDEVEVISCAKINVTKTANPSSGCPLDLVTFDINVTNTGKVPLDQVTVVDALPEGLEYNSSTPNGTIRGRDITWNLEDRLEPGESNHTELVARIIQTSPGILNNTVNAIARNQNVTANDSDEVEVISCAKINVTKTANPSSGCPLDLVTFDINVTNTGKVPLDHVTVVDALPEGLEYLDSILNETIEGRAITWNLEDTLEPGESNHTKLIAQIIQNSSGILNNTVNATARNQNVTDNASAEIEVISCAKINVTKTANPSSGCYGDPITFDINVTNTGKVPLDHVTVVDALPGGMEYLNNLLNETIEGQKITWNLEDPLEPGDSNHTELVARIIQTSPGPLNNTVNATGRHQNGNVTALDNETVEVLESCASINVTKTANPSSGCPFDNITFDINVTNTGMVQLDQVTVVDTLPEGMEYLNNLLNETIEGQKITWNLEDPLEPGDSNHTELVARIIQTSPGPLNNIVNATCRHQNGNVTGYDNETVEVKPCDANVSIQKSVSPSSGYPLTIVKFIINVTNTGNQPLNPVTVKDDLPKGLIFIDSTPEGTKDGQNISWTLSQMDPGQSENIKLLAQIDWLASGNMQNCVEVIGIPPNGLNITDIEDKPVKAMSCAIVNLIPIPPQPGLGCWNCCNNCCSNCCYCPGNITNNINLNNSGQGIQVVTIVPANVSNLSQEIINSSNKYNEIKS